MKLDKKKLKFYKKELENFKKHGVKISETYSYNLSHNQQKAITAAIAAIDENIKLKKQIKELKEEIEEQKEHQEYFPDNYL